MSKKRTKPAAKKPVAKKRAKAKAKKPAAKKRTKPAAKKHTKAKAKKPKANKPAPKKPASKKRTTTVSVRPRADKPPTPKTLPKRGTRDVREAGVGAAWGLSLKQEKFCREYVRTYNAAEAARRAGYSARSAKEQGMRLLTHAHVADFCAELVYSLERRIDEMHVFELSQGKKILIAEALGYTLDKKGKQVPKPGCTGTSRVAAARELCKPYMMEHSLAVKAGTGGSGDRLFTDEDLAELEDADLTGDPRDVLRVIATLLRRRIPRTTDANLAPLVGLLKQLQEGLERLPPEMPTTVLRWLMLDDDQAAIIEHGGTAVVDLGPHFAATLGLGSSTVTAKALSERQSTAAIEGGKVVVGLGRAGAVIESNPKR